MAKPEILNEYTSEIKAKGITLLIKAIEEYWPGEGTGRMEDMPGTFLETKVIVIGCSPESGPLEQLAAQNQVILYKHKKEITNEPEGYAKLSYADFFKKVKSDPGYYLQNLKKAVKDSL